MGELSLVMLNLMLMVKLKSEADCTHYISGGRVSMAINRCRKPTIAALQGPAVGVIVFEFLSMFQH